MTNEQLKTYFKLILAILDRCKSLEEAKEEIRKLI